MDSVARSRQYSPLPLSTFSTANELTARSEEIKNELSCLETEKEYVDEFKSKLAKNKDSIEESTKRKREGLEILRKRWKVCWMCLNCSNCTSAFNLFGCILSTGNDRQTRVQGH